MNKSASDLGLAADTRIARAMKCGPKNPTFTCDCCGSGLRKGAVELRSYANGFVCVVVGKDCASSLLEQVR